MTDRDLQIALAGLMPEKLEVRQDYLSPDSDSMELFSVVYWRCGDTPKDTEWLHACWLAEQTLDRKEHLMFRNVLARLTTESDGQERPDQYAESNERAYITSSWQQRAEALIKVKQPPQTAQASSPPAEPA